MDIDYQALSDEPKETQIKIMREWFYENFEDPVVRTPYESSDGGYQWIWGGPYDANEELTRKFTGTVPDSYIKELVEELAQICVEWSPTEGPGDYDYEDLNIDIEAILSLTDYIGAFSSSISDIERLLETRVDIIVQDCFYRLLFVNVITVLETYLSDTFINTVMDDSNLLRRYVEYSEDFRNNKMQQSDLFKFHETIEKNVKESLSKIIWHRLKQVIALYKNVLGIGFEHDLENIQKAIMLRHDIIHRNGKDRSGEEIYVSKSDVESLIKDVETLVQKIDSQVSPSPF